MCDDGTTFFVSCRCRNGIIHDAIAADFDGDSKLDLFILYKENPQQKWYHGGIAWGDRVKLGQWTKSIIIVRKRSIGSSLDEIQRIDYRFEDIPTIIE